MIHLIEMCVHVAIDGDGGRYKSSENEKGDISFFM